ncbi:hypothetical protein NE237_025527 [Protea cynaroides]|uniref:NB-ARC domain-containing protein n=1 Tax=Protea cynaroides TaxID=273540 RepID=A0A9Q0H213_9MAGN|nr:hypothetical protein NE237_025527 [Protea cynaroides]
MDIIDKYLIAPLVRRVNYLRNYQDNVDSLQTSVRNMNSKSEIEREADDIQEEYNSGTWRMSAERYLVRERYVNPKAKADLRLTEQFPMARQPSPEPMIEREDEPIENQPSTQRTLQQLIDHIYDLRSRIIGVYGMGGVGKTTLVKKIKINNHFKENFPFDIVIFLLTSISERLRLDLSNTSEDGAREKLLNALRKKNFFKFWMMWSKILITSQHKDTCTHLDAEIKLKVEPLSIDESWNLFVKKAGQHVTTIV